MKTMIENGEAVDAEDGSEGKWYLPHHGVYHPKKPDKLRVVSDCSAEYQGSSLNNYLFQGPDLTNNMIGVLLRFRQERIAIMADRKKFSSIQGPERAFILSQVLVVRRWKLRESEGIQNDSSSVWSFIFTRLLQISFSRISTWMMV